VVHFNGEKNKSIEVGARVDERSEGEAAASRMVGQTVVRLRGFLGRRVHLSRARTLGRRHDASGTATLGAFDDLERELSRSRRFGRPFVLARVPRPSAADEADAWLDRLLTLLNSEVRSVDTVWSDGHDVYLLLPESDRSGGAAALARIREPVSRVLTDEEVDGIRFAVFAPDECPTRQALLSALEQRVKDVAAKTPEHRQSAMAPARSREEASR
jgi:hypothetical protein